MPSYEKKGLYYCRINRDALTNIGILKKIEAQIKAFVANDIRVDVVSYHNEGVLFNEDTIIHRSFGTRLKSLVYFFWGWDRELLSKIDFDTYDFIYIRYPLSYPGFIIFLKQLKDQNKDLKLILEFPTFPYGLELKKKSLFYKLAYYIDRYYQKELEHYVDLAVHYGTGQVLGLPTINIRNKIDIEKIPYRRPKVKSDYIQLVAIGAWNYWHGLDRILEAIAQHNKKKNICDIKLRIIGEGPASGFLHLEVLRLRVSEFVEFASPARGAELDLLLADADIGIGSLGMFRKQVFVDSSLKHREYCGRGLPFILATNDLDFPAELPFIHYVSANESAIDLEKIINWFETLRRSSPTFSSEMRTYAEENLTWDQSIKKLLKFLDL